jgi:hypothetical protein
LPSSPIRGRLKEPDLGRKFLDVSNQFAETAEGLLLVPVTGGIKEESGIGFIFTRDERDTKEKIYDNRKTQRRKYKL